MLDCVTVTYSQFQFIVVFASLEAVTKGCQVKTHI